MSYALQNQLRAEFARELDAISRRSRDKRFDPRARMMVPRPFEKWERLARAETAQRVVEAVLRDKLWVPDRALDQWVEHVYHMGIGINEASAAAGDELGPRDVVSGSSIVGGLDAGSGISLATGVSAWAAYIGGTTLDVTQGTGGLQPAYTANNSSIWGRPTVGADGSNDYLLGTWNPPAPGTTPSWFRFVANRTVDITNGELFGTGTGSGMRCLRITATQVRCSNGTNGPSVTMAVATWHRDEILFNNNTTDYLKVGSNNGTGTNLGNTDPSAFALFAQTNGTNPGAYSIQKVLVCNAEPTALQKALFDGMDTCFYNGNITL